MELEYPKVLNRLGTPKLLQFRAIFLSSLHIFGSILNKQAVALGAKGSNAARLSQVQVQRLLPPQPPPPFDDGVGDGWSDNHLAVKVRQ